MSIPGICPGEIVKVERNEGDARLAEPSRRAPAGAGAAERAGHWLWTPEGRESADSPMTAYRPDIDGLRALAVVSIVLYHLRNGLLPGGFLGVDIFFVISGYLITLILWREIGVGKFKIGKFYERRVRRILPALLAVLLATSIVAILILLPGDLVGFAKSGLATLGFVANVYFWRDSDYFSRVAGEKPLLHLWSLGVEEQFYIFFPLVLFLCCRFARDWAFSVVAGLLVASFGLNVLLVMVGGGGPAFYLLPTRAWEFAAGALLALATPMKLDPLSAEIAGFGGIILIAASLALGPSLPLAGLPVGTLVVVGVALIIRSGASPGGRVAAVLASKPMVAIGLASYSLYLWHWPILVLAKYWLVGDLDPTWSLASLAAMLSMGFVSWRFIERPFRSQQMPVAHVLSWTLAGVVVVALSASSLIWLHGLPRRLNPQAAAINAAVDTHFRCPVRDYVTSGLSRGCVMALPSRDLADADVAMIGNSHALMYAPLLAEILESRGLHGVLLNANGCLPSTIVNISRRCAREAESYIAAAMSLKARIVFIGLEWEISDALMDLDGAGGPVSGSGIDREIAGVAATIESLKKVGKKVVLIGPIAQPGWDVASVVSRSIAFGRPVKEPVYQTRAAFDQKMGPVLQAFGMRSDIIFIRPDLAQCGDDRCNYIEDWNSLFSDDSHLARGALQRFHSMFEVALDAARRPPR